jgi:hypothetical protein
MVSCADCKKKKLVKGDRIYHSHSKSYQCMACFKQEENEFMEIYNNCKHNYCHLVGNQYYDYFECLQCMRITHFLIERDTSYGKTVELIKCQCNDCDHKNFNCVHLIDKKI